MELMAKSPDDTKDIIDTLPDDDPLAELARIVNAGSIFGGGLSVSADTKPVQPEPDVPVPPVSDPVSAVEPEPAAMVLAPEAYEVSQAPLTDLDAALGEQLEAELVSELQNMIEPEPAIVPRQVAAVEKITEAAPVKTEPAVIAAPVVEPMVMKEALPSNTETMLEALSGDDYTKPPAIPKPVSAPVIPQVITEVPAVETPVAETPVAEMPVVSNKDFMLTPPVAPVETVASPEIDFDIFEAEISAAAIAGFPAVDEQEPVPVPVPVPMDDQYSGFVQQGDIDPLDNIQFDAADDDFDDEEDNEHKGRGKGVLAIAAVLVVAFVGGGSAYFLNIFGGPEDTLVVVEADETAVRVKPDNPGGKLIPNQDRETYDAIVRVNDEKESGLVDRSEEPIVSVGARPVTRVILPRADNDTGGRATRPPRGPKTVRTVVVRPDGTLVRNNDEIKTRRQLDEERAAAVLALTSVRQTPQVVASRTDVNELRPRSVKTESVSADDILPPLPVLARPPAPVIGSVLPVVEKVQVAVVLPPAPRPNTFRAQQAPLPLVAAPAVVETTASPVLTANGDFMVQLSSQRSPEAARTTFRSLQRRHSALGEFSADIQRADLGDRGIYHRLRVGPFARAQANQLCQDLKSSGSDCIVRRR